MHYGDYLYTTVSGAPPRTYLEGYRDGIESAKQGLTLDFVLSKFTPEQLLVAMQEKAKKEWL